jgi:hypothetical protein
VGGERDTEGRGGRRRKREGMLERKVCTMLIEKNLPLL